MKKISFLILALVPMPAHAYIGPGTSAGVIASVLGVLGSFVLMIVGLIYYPVKRMLRKRKQPNKASRDQ